MSMLPPSRACIIGVAVVSSQFVENTRWPSVGSQAVYATTSASGGEASLPSINITWRTKPVRTTALVPRSVRLATPVISPYSPTWPAESIAGAFSW